jgi:hypothetical protein
MIVLSVGMPRAGSAWHYSIIHDLMATAGSVEVHNIREKYRLQNILTKANCNIGVLSTRRLGMVMIPALMGNTFVIKAHARPTRTSRLLQRLGLLRITYIYRDPRDAMLSAFESGQEALRDGRINAFSYLTDFNKSLDFIMDYVRIWEKWSNEKNVLLSRYEDLLTNYDHEITRLVGFLPLNGNSLDIQKVIERYRPGAAEVQEQLHFHMGKVGRFRESFSEQEQSILRDRLASYLPRMGYEI